MRRGWLRAAAMVSSWPLLVTTAAAAETPTAAVASNASRDWNFTALLDGKPIGHHRFTVSAEMGDSSERMVRSEADFAVTFLGITAYRYRHRATEQWRGDCLSMLSSTTDDDGKSSSVQARMEGQPAAVESLMIKTGAETESITGCLMSFAYWNPLIAHQTRLLNAQTGKVENVLVSRGAAGTVPVRGQPVNATRWRISGPAQPIDVWYSEHGDWVGLDAIVAGGRKLSYRLQ